MIVASKLQGNPPPKNMLKISSGLMWSSSKWKCWPRCPPPRDCVAPSAPYRSKAARSFSSESVLYAALITLKNQNQLIIVFLNCTFEGFICSRRLILVRMHFQRQFSVRLFNVAIARRFFDAEDFVVIFSRRKDFVNLRRLFRSEILLHGFLGSWWCRFSLTSGRFWWRGFVLN